MERVTSPFLSKYERARVIGVRAKQLSSGYPPRIAVPRGEIDPINVATLELKQKVIPLIIRRTLPNGIFEDWDVNELIWTGA